MDPVKFRTIDGYGDVYLGLGIYNFDENYISLYACDVNGIIIDFGYILDISIHKGSISRISGMASDLGISLDWPYLRIEVSKI